MGTPGQANREGPQYTRLSRLGDTDQWLEWVEAV